MKFFKTVLIIGFLCLNVFANDINDENQSSEIESSEEDYYDDDYDMNWYDDEVEKLGINTHSDDINNNDENPNTNTEVDNKDKKPDEIENQSPALVADNTDEKVETEIKQYLSSDDMLDKDEDKLEFDSYQIEDNRSNMADDEQNKDKGVINEGDEVVDALPSNFFRENDADAKADETQIELTEKEIKMIDNILDNRELNSADLAADTSDTEQSQEKKEDIYEKLPAVEEKMPEEDLNDFTDIIAQTQQGPSKAIQEETKQILNEDHFNLENEDITNPEKGIHKVDDLDKESVEKIYEDIGDDLKELFKFWDDLEDMDVDDSDESEEDTESNELPEKSNASAEKEVFKQEINKEDSSEENESGEENLDETVAIEPTDVNTNDDEANIQDATKTDTTSAEMNNLMTQFAIKYFEDIDTTSEDFDKNVAPMHISLSVGEITEVTSPNYPDVYPNNDIVDWIFEGKGSGIELNILDFSLNGFSGDFMLVVPGGIDDHKENGIVFSYTLDSAKQYTFKDVDRLFVRFQSKSGEAGRGFKLTIKLLEPLEEQEPIVNATEPPMAKPSIQEEESLLVYLAGVGPDQFLDRTEEFRIIVADMAQYYADKHGIDGLDNTTASLTQIISTSPCNVHWPDFNSCTAVRFAVPLADDEGFEEWQLREMWQSLVMTKPFSGRLRELGITEFAVPSEASTMSVWLVISVGVILSAAMLSFALWRWNCTEDYTRMTSFGDGDTESVIKKKGSLDLFSGPHHSLPPFQEKYFDDSTRVNLGGYTNQSYSRLGETMVIDSDDEGRNLASSQRNTITNPRLMFS